MAARRIVGAGSQRDTTAVVGHWAALAVAVVPIIDAIAVAKSEGGGGAKPPAREQKAPRKSIAEPMRARSNSLNGPIDLDQHEVGRTRLMAIAAGSFK